MTLHAILFYALAAFTLLATLVAVTRSQPIHAVAFLTVSFLGTGGVFYLFGAPLPAMLEVLVYAGAIMVLFLFIVMLLRLTSIAHPRLDRALPATLLGAIAAVAGSLVLGAGRFAPTAERILGVSPEAFGAGLFRDHWPAVEAVSILLFAALVGALIVGRREGAKKGPTDVGNASTEARP